MATNNYPFETKATIAAKIATSDDFVRKAVLIMHSRQTEAEQELKETIVRNRMGWMSSHAVPGTKLALKLLCGEELTGEEMGKARAMVASYTKQLAAHFRQQALADNPALNAVARVFGVGV